MQIRSRAAIAASLLGALALTACSPGGASEASDENTIHIVGFAVPEAANKNIAAEFVKTDEGKDVKFETSYGPSGDQSRAVAAGLEADYVHFSVPTDVTRLVDEGLVADDWDSGENKGVVSTSVVVFGVRDGNPKNIQTWADLIKPGVEIVTPNPASSGAARWNALAAYGQVISDGGTEEEATDYVNKFFKNVVSLPGQRPRRHHRLPRRHRRRAHGLRERGHPGRAERRALRVHHPGDLAEDRERRRHPRGGLRAVAGLARLRPQRRGSGPVRPDRLPSAPRRRRLRRHRRGRHGPVRPVPRPSPPC